MATTIEGPIKLLLYALVLVLFCLILERHSSGRPKRLHGKLSIMQGFFYMLVRVFHVDIFHACVFHVRCARCPGNLFIVHIESNSKVFID